jgi:hypothetical protein
LWARMGSFLADHVILPWVGGAVLVLLVPPALALATGVRVLTTTYSVPVWVLSMLVGGWALFALVMLLALGARRSPLVIVPVSTSPGHLRIGETGKATIFYGFYVTNTAPEDRSIVRAELVVRRWTGIVLRQQRIMGYLQENPELLQRGVAKPALLVWTVDPPFPSGIQGRVVLTDNFNLRVSTPRLSWLPPS